jgi:hypothetical protein
VLCPDRYNFVIMELQIDVSYFYLPLYSSQTNSPHSLPLFSSSSSCFASLGHYPVDVHLRQFTFVDLGCCYRNFMSLAETLRIPLASKERSPDVRRLFEQKKIRVVALTAHIATLKGNAQTLDTPGSESFY